MGDRQRYRLNQSIFLKGEPKMARNDVLLEDVRILSGGFRHFSGEKDAYHAQGQRDFMIALEKEVAEQMEADGWNVKWLKPREEGDEPLATLKIKVNFSGFPPQIMLVTSRNKTPLDEETVAILDYADIETADMFLSPYDWSVNGNTGRTAYLSKLFVTIHEDELDLKYADVPLSNGEIEGDMIDAEVVEDSLELER